MKSNSVYHTTHASFLREPGGAGGSTSSRKTKYLPINGRVIDSCLVLLEIWSAVY